MNRIEKLLKEKPFTFCICHSGLIFGSHMSVIARYSHLSRLFIETSVGYINNFIKVENEIFGKKTFSPSMDVIGELDLTEDEKNWVLTNKSKFNQVKVDGGVIYELPNSSFKNIFMNSGDKKLIRK